MAETTIHSSLRAKQWDERFFLEYVRNNRFARYSGTGANSIFQYNETLTGKRGETIHCNLVGVPRGTPNDGSTQLVGNEKEQFQYAHPSTVVTVRDAITVNRLEEQASGIDIRNAARQGLRDMASDYLKMDQIKALDDRTDNGAMTDDQWNTANSGATKSRVLYGSATTAATFAAGLTAATQTPNAAMVRQAKGLAKRTGPGINATNDRSGRRIRPVKVLEDEEWFVFFVETGFFEALQGDATISQANREGWQRYGGQPRTGGSGGNPLFRGGDLVYDGVIIREIPEIEDLPTLATDRYRGYLCGAQAVHVAWAQRTRTTIKKEDDYGYRYGVGFEELRKVDKIFWENSGSTDRVQYGVVSVFAAKS